MTNPDPYQYPVFGEPGPCVQNDGVPIPYPEDAVPPAPPIPSKRGKRALYAVIATALLAVAILVGVFIGRDSVNHAAKSVAGDAPAFVDMCADTKDSAQARSKLIYTDPRYLNPKPVQVSDDSNKKWCTIGTSYESSIMWGLAYVGEDNPIYRTMIAENGDGPDATRAVITYRGVPGIKFAAHGWLGFVTPSDEEWTAFKTGSVAMLMQDIANDAAKDEHK